MLLLQRYGATPEKIAFCDRIYRASGIADRACLPPWLQPVPGSRPMTDLVHSNREARMVQGQCVAELLRKTGGLVRPYNCVANSTLKKLVRWLVAADCRHASAS
jgi:hypothetical protein